MKLTYQQLDAHLKKKLLPVYLLSGNELVLKQDTHDCILRAAKHAGFTEHIRLTLDSTLNENQLYTALCSASLFAQKKVITLQLASTPAAHMAVLKDYAANPSSECLLILEIGKIDDKISRSAWYKALDKIGASITLWPIPREQLPAWIIKRANGLSLSFGFDAASVLADYVEGNLTAAIQTLEKIHLLQLTTPIDSELIKSILSDESQFTIFDFVETLFAGETKRALHMLDTLETDNVELTLILWGISRELHILTDLIQQIKQGQSQDTLFQKYRIFFKRQTAFRHFISKSSIEDCWRHLNNTSHIDRIIKGALPGNAWDALRLFCLRLPHHVSR